MSNCATYGETVHGWLQRRFGRERYAAQALSDKARASRRAAENWLAGACSPNGQTLINLMAEFEDLEAEIRAARERGPMRQKVISAFQMFHALLAKLAAWEGRAHTAAGDWWGRRR